MGWLNKIAHQIADNPVQQIINKVDPLANGVSKTLTKATDIGWGKPLGDKESGLDVLGAGPIYQAFGIGGNPEKKSDRSVGRLVGTIFAGYGANAGINAATDASASSATSTVSEANATDYSSYYEGGDTATSVDANTGFTQYSGSDEAAQAAKTAATESGKNSVWNTLSNVASDIKSAVSLYTSVQTVESLARKQQKNENLKAQAANPQGFYRPRQAFDFIGDGGGGGSGGGLFPSSISVSPIPIVISVLALVFAVFLLHRR